jgi:formate dehydrogenase subunit beta
MAEPTAVERALRTRARKLLEKQEVVGVLGFRQGALPGTSVPFLATSPDDADRLVLNRGCSANLAAYLPKLKHRGRIAVIARGPDSRSIVNLLKENQFERDKLHVIGVADPDDTQPVRNPVISDEFVGERAQDAPPDDYADIREFESLPAAERWQTLLTELSRCIRCYACRQVCPNCYCPTCFVDASRPTWVGRTPDPSDNILFHLMRAVHMAGRCVECGACAKACPVGIPLMTINRKVSLIARERFGDVPGIAPDSPLPLTAFEPEDKEEFIR